MLASIKLEITCIVCEGERGENTTILANYHQVSLTAMNNYLLNNVLVRTNNDLYHKLIFSWN